MRELINTLGDVHDPAQLSEIWDHDVYRAAPHITPGGHVVDVGANVGVFTIWALTNGAGFVTSVEPFVENVAQLKLNLERTGLLERVTVMEAGAAAHVGTCSVMAGGPHGTAERSTGTHTLPGEGVPTVDLDSIIGDHGTVDVLKVDCEGAEYELFSTASVEDMRRIRYLCIEFHVWREPGSHEIPGVGERAGVMPSRAVHRLVRLLQRTHRVVVQGDENAGGYLFGERR